MKPQDTKAYKTKYKQNSIYYLEEGVGTMLRRVINAQGVVHDDDMAGGVGVGGLVPPRER